jgi:hypothetical protein
MKRRDLYNYFQSLNNVGDLKGVKFAYTVIKNKKVIEEEIKLLEEVVKANPEFEKYEQERIQLCEVHSEQDGDGKALIIDNKYKIIDQIKFDKELLLLKDKYQESINERFSQIDDYNKMLDEDVEMTIQKLNFDDLPVNITTDQLESLTFMVNLD